MLGAAPPAAPPSAALALMERLGLMAVLLPELAALRGVPQAKALPGDALDHSLRTADALAADRRLLRLAGLLHDLGKATTLADGHFIGHDGEGAALAEDGPAAAALPRADASRGSRAWCASTCSPTRPTGPMPPCAASCAAWERDLLDDLFALRAADNVASGAREPATGGHGRAARTRGARAGRRPLGAGPAGDRRQRPGRPSWGSRRARRSASCSAACWRRCWTTRP